MKNLLATLLILMAFLAPANAAFSLKSGDRFPELALPTLAGDKETTISALSDKKLMLHLFASW